MNIHSERPKILKYGNPALYIKSSIVSDISSVHIQNIIKVLKEMVKEQNAAGIAAPQIGIPLSIALYSVPQKTNNPKYALTPEYDPQGVPLTVMINPHIKPLGEEMIEAWEGCLSVPGMLGKVVRYKSVECSYFNEAGEYILKQAHGFHARILQHECDHLEGILYPMRLKEITSFGYQDELV